MSIFQRFRRPPDFIIGHVDDPYLHRWYVIPRNKWCNVYLHHFMRSDDDRALHDHPWVNCSILLRGRYVEHTSGGQTHLRKPSALYFRRATAAHRVELIGGQPVWTLFITGPKVREWGFLCPKGWRHWDEFVAAGTGSGTGASVTGVGCGDAS